jgi:nucleosome binding factor SPN SPT16 subunit
MIKDVPHRQISAIDTKYLEPIQDWLNDQSITYTYGKATLQWGPTIKEVKEQIAEGVFYLDVDPETGEKKDPGWLFLSQEDPGGEEEEEDESSYSEESEESESESDSDEDSDEYEDESDDDSEYDDDELSEEGEVI